MFKTKLQQDLAVLLESFAERLSYDKKIFDCYCFYNNDSFVVSLLYRLQKL